MRFLSVPAKLVENRATLTLLFFLALSAIALSVWQGFSFFKGKIERGALVQNAINNGLVNLQHRVEGQLVGNVVALNVLAAAPALQAFIDGDRESGGQVRELFTAILQSNTNAFQVRYINRNGDERIRFDRVGNEIAMTEAEALQNKVSRDYFREAMQLTQEQIYVSDLNLNVEEGEAQTPWVPTLRIARPVFNSGGEAAGIIVVNIHAGSFIDLYDTTNNNARVEIMLANADGYWLYGRPRDMLWGFMFDNQQTVADVLPEVWNKVRAGNERAFNVDGDNWTVLPARVADLLPDSLQYSAPDKVLWYALVLNPPQPIGLNPGTYVPTLVILLAVIGFSWAWAKSVIEKRRTERELVKSEKMSSLGGLVAGVAHELNTPIGSAVTIASTMHDQSRELRDEIETGKIRKSRISEFVMSVHEAAAIILRGLNRANELIAHFKQIAVDQSGEKRRQFVLDEYIKEMSATFYHLFKHRSVNLELDLESNATLDSFPGPLSQVVINLVQNALLHGFRADEAGVIRLTTRRKGNHQVQLEVYDNGAGIPDPIVDRIFEPFFTTKLGQGGSGLGLHIVYNIIHDVLGGELKVVSSTERRFTRFVITLPLKAKLLTQNPEEGFDYVQRTAA